MKMDNVDKLQEMFSEFLKIYKFINRPQIVAALNTELNDKTKMMIYELSNGENTARDIGKKAGTSFVTVTNYWKQWALKGIAIPAQRKGRYMAAFDLTEYGLSVITEGQEEDE